MTRRQFLRSLASASGLGLGTLLYAWKWELHWPEIVHFPLAIANLPASLVGRRMVQLSDLHISPYVDESYLLNSFDLINHLSPDIVVYTGDFTSISHDVLPRAKRVFPHLPKGRSGTFGVLGNHDYGVDWSQPALADNIVRIANDCGIRILRNEVADVEGLQIIGMDDLWGGRFRPFTAFAQARPEQASVVLSHNPDTADLPGWKSFNGWILSGHTHGGQCKPPFLPPPILPVKNKRYTSGPFLLSGERCMYISRGLGHLLPVRFNVRPEITVFHLQPA